MRRFIDGKYSSTSGKPGYMLGFVVRGDTDKVVMAINNAIQAEPDLGTSDQLGSVTVPHHRFTRFESTHVDEIRLIHNLLDVRLTSKLGSLLFHFNSEMSAIAATKLSSTYPLPK
jgi:hypothetical protein